MTPADERHLALFYSPRAARAGLGALLALDAALGDVLRSAREPMLAQMRYSWWHEQLTNLTPGTAPAMPVLVDLSTQVVGRGVPGALLARQVEGWEVLIDEDLTPDLLAEHGRNRGSALFEAALKLLGENDPAAIAAGEGWALADLAMHLSAASEAAKARAAALPLIEAGRRHRWSRRTRTLGAWVRLAHDDLVQPAGQIGSPRRVGGMLWHAMTGR